MSDFLYDKTRGAFLNGSINLGSDTIKTFLIDSADYTASQSADDFFDDIPGAAVVGTPTALASITTTAGVFDAADTTLTSVTGDQSEAVVIMKSTGTDSTSNLICYITTYTGLPVTPNGGNITIAWPNDSNKIFKI